MTTVICNNPPKFVLIEFDHEIDAINEKNRLSGIKYDFINPIKILDFFMLLKDAKDKIENYIFANIKKDTSKNIIMSGISELVKQTIDRTQYMLSKENKLLKTYTIQSLVNNHFNDSANNSPINDPIPNSDKSV